MISVFATDIRSIAVKGVGGGGKSHMKTLRMLLWKFEFSRALKETKLCIDGALYGS